VVEGNRIGAAIDGVNALGNHQNGVMLANGAANNRIGGDLPGAGNIIAFNGRSGIVLEPSSGSGNAIRGNTIVDNAVLGIDLDDDGVTSNDDGDNDGGPNQLQNAPILTSARSIEGVTTVAGVLHASASTRYEVELFLNNAGDGSGQGRQLLGVIPVTTD